MEIANFSKAIKEADQVLRDNFAIEPPIHIDEIAKNYGLKIVEADFGVYSNSVAGLINPKDNTIYVNKQDSSTRKAFTIAHELGHFLLHNTILNEEGKEKYKVLYRKPLGELNSDPVEQEANCFAANLLVPSSLLVKYKNSDINTIAKIFGVSPEVIGYRMKNE